MVKPEYFMDDYDTYSLVFHQQSMRISDLMRILDTCVNIETGLVVGRPKDLFRMVMDMLYMVDRSYEKEKGIVEERDHLFHYSFKDDAKEEMRNLLREEIERYFDNKKDA